MTQIAFIRHGPTQWNSDGLIQGQSDVPLSEAGRSAVASWQVPPAFSSFDWVASPLGRAHETARLLGAPGCSLEPRLMEANWGDWEGRNLKVLREELGEELVRNEARGLDLTPPGGESPRQVRTRLSEWLAEIGPEGRHVVAVTHAGVLRAAYSLATGWDMKTNPPYHRGHGSAHLYDLAADGGLAVRTLDIDLRGDG